MYPLGANQIELSKQRGEENKKQLMNKVSHLQSTFLSKNNDFSAVQQEHKDNIALKKIVKSPFNIEEMDKIFKGSKKKWTDPDFNY